MAPENNPQNGAVAKQGKMSRSYSQSETFNTTTPL